MDVLDILSNEHGLIRRYLEEVSLAAEKMESGAQPPREFFDKAIEFARAFADRYHHFKEEYLMFVRMAQKRKGEIDAQLEALRQQHERGRNLVAAMAERLDGYAKGDPIAAAELLENLAGYASLLKHHIHTEDHVFYPMARRELDAEDMARLLEEFENDRARTGERTFENSHKLVVDMGSILAHM